MLAPIPGYDPNDFSSHFGCEVFGSNEITDEIAIVPETMCGPNPYGAKKVVRYLLHKRGFFGNIKYGENELVIGYGRETSGNGCVVTEENAVKIIYSLDCYKQENFGERTKTCYMKRKCKQPDRIFHSDDSLCVDGLNHKNLAMVFNECKEFICYDPYTHYSTYAALCGCTSIVIPEVGVSKEEWKPNVKDTYGIAYGVDDVEYALETKEKFLEYQDEIPLNNIKAVQKLIQLAECRFQRPKLL